MAASLLSTESRTLHIMVAIYCRGMHGHRRDLCQECTELVDYAAERVEHCTWGANKPACANCTIHCYKPAMRQRVIAVMRYAGPRMATRHPLLAFLHLARKIMVGRPQRPIAPSRARVTPEQETDGVTKP